MEKAAGGPGLPGEGGAPALSLYHAARPSCLLPPSLPAPRPQTTAGLVYEGVFHGIAPRADGGVDIQLKMARLVADPSVPPQHLRPQLPAPTLTIPWDAFAALTAADVRMGESDVGAVAWDDAGGFGTDAAISRSRGSYGRERELQRWAPEAGEESLMMGLEDSRVGPVERGWDQFALNEAKFGVKTGFREELYTTQLDPRCCLPACLLPLGWLDGWWQDWAVCLCAAAFCGLAGVADGHG